MAGVVFLFLTAEGAVALELPDVLQPRTRCARPSVAISQGIRTRDHQHVSHGTHDASRCYPLRAAHG